MIERIKKIIAKKPTARKETVPELLCWVVSCWLIAVGVCLILDSHMAFHIGVKSILWQTLFAVAGACFLSRRWWITFIYFGILVPVFFLAISLSGDIYGFFGSVASFVKWWVQGMPYSSKWYSDQGLYMVRTLINVGVGILFFVVARLTKRAWAVVLLAFLFVIDNYIKGYTNYNVLAIPFLLVGIFPLLAGQKFQKIKIEPSDNTFGVLGKKWLFVTVSTITAVAVLAVGFAVASTSDEKFRTRFSSNVVADFQTATNTFTQEQQKLGVTLFDLGLVTNTTYIGGNLYEIEPEIIATTNLTEPTLIKLTSFDTFNGMNWTTNFKKGYRINGIWQDEQSLYLSSALIDDAAFRNAIADIGYTTSVDITMRQDTNFLLTTGQVLNFSENTPTANPILFDELGRIVSYYGQNEGYSYSLDVLNYDTSDKVVKSQISTLLSDYKGREDGFYNESNPIYKSCTEALANQPEEIKKIIADMDFTDENEYQKAYEICKYFSKKNGFKYDKKLPSFKKTDNVISKLLEDKKGHCMYYSTAMIALAREAGIPSRLAAGYRTIPSADGKTQVIDKSSPYAWVECYIPHMGWIAFDPSPIEKQKAQINKNDNNGDKKNPQAQKGDVDLDIPEESISELPQEKSPTNFLPIILICLGVLCVILLILNTLLSHKAYELKAVRNRFKSTKQQAEFYYQDMLRQLSWLKFRFKPGETISEFAVRVSQGLYMVDSSLIFESAKVIEALHYADKAPENDQIETIFRLRRALERVIKRKNNTFIYIIKRRFLLFAFTFKTKKYK